MRHAAMTAVAAMAAVLAGAAAPAAQAQEDFRWSERVQQVRIQGISGDVRAELASGNRVEVVARRTGRDAGRIRVEAVESGDGVTICAVYPGSGGRGDGPCRGEGRGNGVRVRDARVDFVVRVPAGVRLNVGIVDGDVNATGLRSPVQVATVSGDVRLSTTGSAEANTVDGDIDAAFGASEGRMRFNTVSGDVTLRLGANVGARVRANTLSGEIDSDFPLDRGGRPRRGNGGVNVQIGAQASGTIGRGGAELGINTLSGDVRIVRAR